MEQQDRSAASDTARFGYNGMLKDNDLKREGNSYTTEFRGMDPRIGRWWSLDPKPSASESEYSLMGNNPILNVDLLGLDTSYYAPKPTNEIEVSAKYWKHADEASYKNTHQVYNGADMCNDIIGGMNIGLIKFYTFGLLNFDPKGNDLSSTNVRQISGNVDLAGNVIGAAVGIGGIVEGPIGKTNLVESPTLSKPVIEPGAAIKPVTEPVVENPVQQQPAENYTLDAAQTGKYPVMKRGSKEPDGEILLKKGDVWKIGETIHPKTRYSQNFLDETGEGLYFNGRPSPSKQDAIRVQKSELINYKLKNGKLPPGNKITN